MSIKTTLRRLLASAAGLTVLFAMVPVAGAITVDGDVSDFPHMVSDVCGTSAANDDIHQQGEKAKETNWSAPTIQSPNTGDDFCSFGASVAYVGTTLYSYAAFTLFSCDPAATTVSFELNSGSGLSPAGQPLRSVNDLWIDVIVDTPNPLSVAVYRWDGSDWAPVSTPPALITAAFNVQTCTGEISVNLSALGLEPNTCADAYTLMSAHTRSSASFESSLKDYGRPTPIPAELCAINVEKTANPTSAAVGQTVTYTFVVTNPGKLPLINIQVVDPKCDAAPTRSSDGGDSTNTVLDPGDTWTYTCTRVILASDPDPLPNTVTVTGYDEEENPVSDTDNASVDILYPLISVEKSVTGGSHYDTVGDVISYSIVVTNTGEVTLTNVNVSDPGADADSIDCNGATAGDGNPIASIAVGANVTCTAAHTVTLADLNAGSYDNCATAVAAQNVDDEDCATATGDQHPAIHLEKDVASTTPAGAIVLGSVVHYALVISNTGNVTLTNVTLTDPGANPGSIDCNGASSGSGLPLPSLAPGASRDCTAAHTVTQDDVDNGSYTNTATTTGTPPTGPNVSDTDDASVEIPMNPSIDLQKTESSVGPYSVGEAISYKLVATNNGNVTLSNVTVKDNNADSTPDCNGATAGTGQPISKLAVGASVTCTAMHTVTQDDVDTGNVHNLATATGTPPKGKDVTDIDEVDVPIAQNPSITLQKDLASVSPTGAIAVGSVLTYDLEITNSGNVTLTAVTLTDPGADAGSIDCNGEAAGTGLPLPSLAPLASVTCSAAHTVTQADVQAGVYKNVATTTGNPPTGDPVSDDDDETVTVPQNPAINIDKTVTSTNATYQLGDTVTYSLVTKNTGNVILTNVTVSDPTADSTPDCNGSTAGTGQPIAALAPGESVTCTATHVVTASDVTAGSVVNVATSKGTPPRGTDVVSTDTATVPVIEVKEEVAVPPTTTTTTTTTSVAAAVGLPVTGAEILEFGGAGLALLGSGYGMVFGVRRRRRAAAGTPEQSE